MSPSKSTQSHPAKEPQTCLVMASSSSQRLAHLRALAQSHLTEIETEKQVEQTQQSQAEADIQRYAKLSYVDRKQQAQAQASSGLEQQLIASNTTTSAKRERFRPFNEILHRIKWDTDLDINDYLVGYLERFEGMKEMPASSWIRDFSDEEWIPMHRVRYVKRVKVSQASEDKGPELGVVWDRDTRVDKISRLSSDGDEVQLDDILSIDGTSVTGGMQL